MSLKILHPDHHQQRRRLIHGRETPRKHGLIQRSHLAGQDVVRKAGVLQLYAGLPPIERSKLRAQRARRGLDVIDLFHQDAARVFADLDQRQRAAVLDLMLLTNSLRPKLRGIARGEPVEL
jgi:hypothetical protein